MKLLLNDIKHKTFKIQVDSTEDLWYLSTIIEEGDTISGQTERKVRIGGSEEKSKIAIRNVFLSVTVDKITYEPSELRISGPIIDGPEDIPRGDFHTFAMRERSIITLNKTELSFYITKKIEEACTPNMSQILIVAFDREEALFALLKSNGYEILLDLKGDVSKKEGEEKKSNFYTEIVNQINAYDARYHFTSVVVASPAFWKEYLMKEIHDENLRKRITLATCSSIDENAIQEVLRRSELKTVLQKDRSSREELLVEELLAAISKDMATYGYVSVREKLDAGNVLRFLISENLIKQSRANNTYRELEELMHAVDVVGAQFHIISSPDAVKKLDGLSGIAIIQRWKENY